MKYPSVFFRLRLLLLAAVLLATVGVLSTGRSAAQEGDDRVLTETMRRFMEDIQPAQPLSPLGATPCVDGMADIYPCENVDLLSFIPLSTFSAGAGNDSWGWTDPLDGKEYALMGLNNGTGFVDISDPVNPIYLGKLPTHTSPSSWRDIKVYNNYAFVVSEAGGHGMQVFDLTELRNVVNPPVTFSESAHYPGFGNAHNLVINEDSGYAYAVGTQTCSGGLHMVNIQDPLNPTNAGCFSADGYTHDAQCVIYNGPDVEHQGDEICFNSNEDTLTIVDVTNKAAPQQLSKTPYAGSAYTHQGWLTEDHTYFLLDDELDETSFGHNTRTRIFDVSNLEAPVFVDYYDSPAAAIDHNQYVLGNYTYQGNYRAGLRILDISDIANGNLTQFGYFDIYPANDNTGFNGAWSVFPYYESGVVIISGIEQGLFVVKPNLPTVPYAVALSPPDMSGEGEPGDTVDYVVTIKNEGTSDDTYDLTVSGGSWTTTLSVSSISLDSGESDTFTVSVEIPGGGSPGDSDTATVTATSTGDPSVSASASLSTSVPVQYGVALSGDQSSEGQPGVTVDYTLTVTNTGNSSDTFNLAVSGENWTTTLSDDSLTLDAGESSSFTVSVEVPGDAAPGSVDTATITATSGGDPGVSASANVTTSIPKATYDVEITADTLNKSGQPGTTVEYSVTVTNLGSITDTFNLVVSGDKWVTTLSEDSVILGAGSSTVITMSVTIPDDAADGDMDIITLSATSTGDPGTSDSLNVTTVADVEVVEPNFPTYLPIMLSQP